MEQRNAIPLSVVLFLSTDNRCANGFINISVVGRLDTPQGKG